MCTAFIEDPYKNYYTLYFPSNALLVNLRIGQIRFLSWQLIRFIKQKSLKKILLVYGQKLTRQIKIIHLRPILKLCPLIYISLLSQIPR